MSCGCNSVSILGSGGVSAGGSALVVDNRIVTSGGAKSGGTAIVHSSVVWSDYGAIYPLGDSEGTELVHGLDGVLTGTSIDDGVYCLSSTRFDATNPDFITIPADGLHVNQGFTVSMWAKIDDMWNERALYARGNVFRIGYSVLNHLTAKVTTDEDEYVVLSSTTLSRTRWYHVASTWTPGESLKVFINGVQRGSIDVPEDETSPLTTSGSIGGYDGGFITGNLMELRLQPERTSDWLLCEYLNFCDPTFVIVGDETSEIYF